MGNKLQELQACGSCIVEHVFSDDELERICSVIQQAETSSVSFRKSTGLFAIRGLLQELPELKPLLWTSRLQRLVAELGGSDFFCTKAIFFDKPADSNWAVNWHQDLMISVKGQVQVEHFGPWSSKKGWITVQPSLELLENILTLRIHLDDCREQNGALKVVPGSHRQGIIKATDIEGIIHRPKVCSLSRGGVLAMKPLLLHASGKNRSELPRRVIHLEFSSLELPNGLEWREREEIFLEVPELPAC
jgi:hypothetical protein